VVAAVPGAPSPSTARDVTLAGLQIDACPRPDWPPRNAPGVRDVVTIDPAIAADEVDLPGRPVVVVGATGRTSGGSGYRGDPVAVARTYVVDQTRPVADTDFRSHHCR